MVKAEGGGVKRGRSETEQYGGETELGLLLPMLNSLGPSRESRESILDARNAFTQLGVRFMGA